MNDSSIGSAALALAGGPQSEPSISGGGPTQAQAVSAPSNEPSHRTPAANDWLKDWSAEDKGFIEKKGFRGPEDLYKSYRNLESTMRSDRLVMPKDADDKEAYEAIYKRLGRPEKPEEYKFGDEADKEMVGRFAPVFHKNGLTQSQAEGITKEWAGYVSEAVAKQNAEWAAREAAEMKQLENDWGQDFNRNTEIFRRAKETGGFSTEEIDGMMRVAGVKKIAEFFRKAGGPLVTEDNVAGIGNEGISFASMTANRAKAELAELKGNREFMERRNNGDRNAVNKFRSLLEKAYPGTTDISRGFEG